jgi:hypothetical protein
VLPKSRDKLAIAIVAAVLAAVIGAALFLLLPDKLVIADVSRPGIHRIAAGSIDDGIYSLDLSGSGKFEGTVKLELLTSSSQVIREVALDNSGEFELQTDWYSHEAFIRVTPGTATAGRIELRYRFVGFR